MKLNGSAKKITAVATVALLSAFSGSVAMVSAHAATSSAPVVAFRPAINPIIDVLTPDGSPRQYPTATGTTLWSPTSGFAIAKGDKIKLNVFVSTGNFELKVVKVRLDNVPLATIDKQPWNILIDSSTLDAGYHQFEIFAQSDSPAPSSSSEQNIAFYIGQNSGTSSVKDAPPQALTPVPAPVAPVTPAAPTSNQAASNPDVTTSIPFGAGRPMADSGAKAGSSQETITGETPKGPTPVLPTSYPLPTLLASAKFSPSATISFKQSDGTNVSGVIEKIYDLADPIELVSRVPVGSTSRHLVYALYRGGQIVYQTDQQLPAGATKIRLQARNGGAAGLLPGSVTLKAWGVDANGNYGPATVLSVDVPGSGTPEAIK